MRAGWKLAALGLLFFIPLAALSPGAEQRRAELYKTMCERARAFHECVRQGNWQAARQLSRLWTDERRRLERYLAQEAGGET